MSENRGDLSWDFPPPGKILVMDAPYVDTIYQLTILFVAIITDAIDRNLLHCIIGKTYHLKG